MLKGTITMRDGSVVAVQCHVEGLNKALLGAGTLSEVLKALKNGGWEPDGPLPPFTTTEEYTIPIVNHDYTCMFVNKTEWETVKTQMEGSGWEWKGNPDDKPPLDPASGKYFLEFRRRKSAR